MKFTASHFFTGAAWKRFQARGTLGHMMNKRPIQPRKQHRKTFIREWRKYRNLTLEQLADRVDMQASALSYLERGQSAYTQGTLEALADALMTSVPSLLTVDPNKEGEVVDLMRILQNASPEDRAEIVGYAKGRLTRH